MDFQKKEVAKENKKRKFGDDFNAMCPIATLLNEVFILKNMKSVMNIYWLMDIKLKKRY